MKGLDDKHYESKKPTRFSRALLPLVAILVLFAFNFNGSSTTFGTDLIFSPLLNTPAYLRSLFNPIETTSAKKHEFPDVEFDGSSLSLLGQRVFIQGE